ncbi:inositol hexakisphosphate and diphosphoinositol-pentakisphosphate kinase [Exophiala oligosperma]
MTTSHGIQMTPEKLHSSQGMFQSPSKSPGGVCNLCQTYSKRLKSHVGRHLQQLSLFALPRFNDIQGSGKAELDSESSRLVVENEPRSSRSSSISEGPAEGTAHQPYSRDDRQILEGFGQDYVYAPEIPKLATEVDWDNVTDKFSQARGQAATQTVTSTEIQILSRRKILGVCAFDEMARSSSSQQIWSRLLSSGIEVIIFGDKTILDDDFEDWPICDALLVNDSEHFPLHKAIAYARLRQPFLINDLWMQDALRDRRISLMILARYSMRTPRQVFVNRDDWHLVAPEGREQVLQKSGFDLRRGVSLTKHVEMSYNGDSLWVDGTEITKPFVEKPANAWHHDFIVYFPSFQSGGARRLFLHGGKAMSEYIPDLILPRCFTDKGSSYIYEAFLGEQSAMHVKVFNMDSLFCHAKMRSSPLVDDRVRLDTNDKEMSHTISPSVHEKFLSNKVTQLFGPRICSVGFIRVDSGLSYVVSVGRCEFPGSDEDYYEQCSTILRSWIDGTEDTNQVLPTIPSLPSFSLKGLVVCIQSGDHVPIQSLSFQSESEELHVLLKQAEVTSIRGSTVLKKALKEAKPALLGNFENFDQSLWTTLCNSEDVQVKLCQEEYTAPQRYIAQPLYQLSWGGRSVHSLRYQCEDLGRSMREEYALLNRTMVDDVEVHCGPGRVSCASAEFWAASFLARQEVGVNGDQLPQVMELLDDLGACDREKMQNILGMMRVRAKHGRGDVGGWFEVRAALRECIRDMNSNFDAQNHHHDVQVQGQWCTGEDERLFRFRWQLLLDFFELHDELYNHPWDLPLDPYALIRFDALHNRQIAI